MQVGRGNGRKPSGGSPGPSGGRVSNTWVTCLSDRDNTGKPVLIPDTLFRAHAWGRKGAAAPLTDGPAARSEEHTSELQSRDNLVCRLLLEKKTAEQHHAVRSISTAPRRRSPPPRNSRARPSACSH